MTADSTKARRAPRTVSDSRQAPGEPIAPEPDGTAKRAIWLLDEWMADESGYDEETWPRLKTALERDRLSGRNLFDG